MSHVKMSAALNVFRCGDLHSTSGEANRLRVEEERKRTGIVHKEASMALCAAETHIGLD